MKSHEVRLPKKSKKMQPSPVRPSVWRPNNPDPYTDYGEMQEDDEPWGESDSYHIPWSESASDSVMSISELDVSESPEEGWIEPTVFQRGRQTVTRQRTLTIQHITSRRDSLRSHAATPPSPDPGPPRISRLPTKPNKK
jgi:hypothetical protein